MKIKEMIDFLNRVKHKHGNVNIFFQHGKEKYDFFNLGTEDGKDYYLAGTEKPISMELKEFFEKNDYKRFNEVPEKLKHVQVKFFSITKHGVRDFYIVFKGVDYNSIDVILCMKDIIDMNFYADDLMYINHLYSNVKEMTIFYGVDSIRIFNNNLKKA